MGTQTLWSRNEKIFGVRDPAEYFYKIKSGCIRTYNVLNDGRRRICAFYFSGDYFGMEACKDHGVTAETVAPTCVLVIKRKVVMASVAGDIPKVRRLLNITAVELRRAQNHNLLLLKGAQERVVDFLLEMVSRKQGQSEVDLPMPRQDIADYLGLTIETVSRVLTRLESASAISLLNYRRIVLRDLSALN
jgi:CRP/FNR family nitrogen fixation transcriptional regulator